METKGIFSHKSDDWATPEFIYSWFMRKGFYDPCPYRCKDDAFHAEWPSRIVFINPPYSKCKEFVDFALMERLHHVQWWLVPARTDTHWFHRLFEYSDVVIFIGGRLKFDDGKLCAPFPSVLMRVGQNAYGRKSVYNWHRDALMDNLEWLYGICHEVD